MYALMLLSLGIFLFFGLQCSFEEDVLKLLPRSSMDNELAFSEIELKDKVFLMAAPTDSAQVEPDVIGRHLEAFCRLLEQADSSTGYVRSMLYRLDAEMALGAMDYALAHLPTFIDTSWYRSFDEALQPEALEAQMQRNYDLIMEDEDGMTTQLVSMDPLALRDRLIQRILPEEGGSVGGFTLVGEHLFCPDRSMAIAFVTPSFSNTNSLYSTRFYRLLKRLASQYQAEHPEVSIYFHGNPLGSVSNSITIKKDLLFTIGGSLLLILIVILLSFQHFNYIWQQLLPITYGAAFALACMYWIKGGMSLMALGLGAIVLGVAISYCLHVLIHFYYVGDTEKMLRDESTPVFLGCITTVGAFMGLMFTESELLSDFGLFATFALLGNTFFALVFLPHMLSTRQIRFRKRHGFPLVERLNNLPWDRNIPFIVALVVLIIVGIAFSPKVKFDKDLRNLNYDEPTITYSRDLYNEKTADGYMHLYYAAYSEHSLDEALEANKVMFRHLDSLKALDIVKGYSDLAPLLFLTQEDQKERIRAWKAYWNPARIAATRRDLREAAARYKLAPNTFDPFIALLQTEYEPGDLVASGIVPPGLMSNYIEQQEGGRIMVFTDVAYDMRDMDTVNDDLTSCPNVIVVEPFYYCRDMVEIVHDDFSTTLWISSLFVLIVLLLSFRNIWTALIAFLPMFVSWYVMQGYMALFGLEFNLINIVISTFIYGIGVDYSIFVMEGLLQEARTGEKNMLVYHKVAIFYSALVLAIVTGSLVFATHPAIHSIGLITLIGMASTILITYSLQPFVFRQLLKIPSMRRRFRVNQ